MTRKLSLTTAIAVVALSVGAPAAFAKVHAQAEVAPNRALPKASIGTNPHEYPFSGDRQSLTALGLRGEGVDKKFGRVENTLRFSDSADGAGFAGTRETAVVSATGSGREIEWPQVGVGLGIGLLLALGLGVIMRVTHIRRFAH
jgi:hypothetical protein